MVKKAGLIAPKKAWRNIHVRKVLFLNEENGKLYTPFQGHNVQEKNVQGEYVMESGFSGEVLVKDEGSLTGPKYDLRWWNKRFPPKAELNLVDYSAMVNDAAKKRGFIDKPHMRINKGIHTYRKPFKLTMERIHNFGLAWKWVRSLSYETMKMENPTLVLYDAVIPKGAYYYEGYDCDYVSTKIVLKKVLQVKEM